MMQRCSVLITLLALFAAFGCSSSSSDGGVVEPPGGGGGPGGTGALTATFTPDLPNPGNDTVSASVGSIAGTVVNLNVDITDTDDVYGAAFDVRFDASMVELAGWAPGAALEAGGNNVTYVVDQPTAGLLVIGISRQGGASSTDVTGSQALIQLNFRALKVGDATVSFQNAFLQNAQPQDLPGITWGGGTLSASTQ